MPAWLSQTLKRTRSGLSFLKRTKDKDSDSGLDTPGTTTPAIGSSTNNLTISYSYNHPLPDLPPGIATPATATDDDVPSAPPTNPAARAESRSDREKQKERDRRKGIRMPTLSSAHQRDAIREFMVITGQNERVAKQVSFPIPSSGVLPVTLRGWRVEDGIGMNAFASQSDLLLQLESWLTRGGVQYMKATGFSLQQAVTE